MANNNAEASAQAAIAVVPPPWVTLSANPTTVTSGDSSTLTWSSGNADVVVSSNFGASALQGSMSVSVAGTTTYTITVANSALQGASARATASATCTVTVTGTVLPPSGGGGPTPPPAPPPGPTPPGPTPTPSDPEWQPPVITL